MDRKPSEMRFAKPCPVKYEYPGFQGKHNVVGIYDRGRMVGKRCASCRAVAS